MHIIPEQLWNQIHVKTWQDLDPHLWMDFRLALMEAETEEEVQGVIVHYTRAFNEVFTELQAQGVNIEFSPTVLTTTTEMITNIVVSNRDYKTSMLEYLPYYERKTSVFNALLDAYDKEFRRLEQELEIIDRNMFLDTAIEELGTYERDLGIQYTNELDYKQRREQIISRYRASFNQTTEESITNVAIAYGNGEISISHSDELGVFDIIFEGIGIPNNIDGLTKALQVVFPAHLGFKYVFRFIVYRELKDFTWEELASKTWSEVRELEGVINDETY